MLSAVKTSANPITARSSCLDFRLPEAQNNTIPTSKTSGPALSGNGVRTCVIILAFVDLVLILRPPGSPEAEKIKPLL